MTATTRILDLLDEQPNPPPKVRGVRKHAISSGRVIVRRPEQVDTIVIHQTACTFGKRRDQPTRHHRALHVACHALAFNDGVVVRPNHVSWFVFHANKLSARSVGLEIEGSFPGLADDPDTPEREDLETLWGDHSRMTPVTDLVVASARRGLSDLYQRLCDWGAKPKYIAAHRQSSWKRRSDPGEELWKRVVLEYAVPVCGLQTVPGFTIGSGRAIPGDWDPDGTARY